MANDDSKNSVKDEMKEKTSSFILAGFSLVAGLAWNEAITALINTFFPSDRGGVMAKFIYAIILTVFLVLVSNYIIRIMSKKS